MDKTAIIVFAVVGALGLLSAVLGFIAEGANPYNPSPALGICASIFLLAAQITVSAVGGCCGCCKSRATPSDTNRIVGIVCAVVSWILAVIALVLFFQGASLNSMGYYQVGLYAGGGVLTLLATALGITSFIMLRSQPAADVDVVTASAANNQEGKQPPPPVVVPIGHPQSQQAVAAEGTVNRPREHPLLHTAGTTRQPQVPQPQVYVLQPQSQHPVQPQHEPQLQQPQTYVQPQVPLAPLPQGIKPEKQQTGIGNQMLKKGVEFGVDLLVETLLPDNTDPLAMAGDTFISTATGTAGGDTEATDSGDASC